MEPTIRERERILVDMEYFRDHLPDHSDVVIFRREEKLLIKRVAALPGDTIEGRDGTIYLNGSVVPESYAEQPGHPPKDMRTFGPFKLKAGEYFVIGDNRDKSFDSRFARFGLVPRTAILGRPMYILVTEDQDRAWKRIQ